jgi:excisionase family DNA binding protein
VVAMKALEARCTPRLADFPALLSIEHACKLLGVSRSAAYRAAAVGELPTLRFGRRLYVPTARLFEMLGLPMEAEG